MSMLDIALKHASKGYPVFPCKQDKRPKTGLNDWENVATTDTEQIIEWWTENPDFLPAIPPGRLGLAVIDVDRHEGKESGFDSLDKANITLKSKVFGTSVSGNGLHYWHRHEVGSLNIIFPGVDRKAHGGYVVVPYELPLPTEITEPLPQELAEGVKSRNVERKAKSNFELNEWLATIGWGEPDLEMWDAVEAFRPRGNQQMSVNIAKVVSLGAQGHPGATAALERMKDIWLSVTHYSGDPDEEFQVNVRSAIEKFGEPVVEMEDPLEALRKKLNPEVTVNLNELAESLRTFCTALDPEWEASALWRSKYDRCVYILQYIHSATDVEEWRTKTKEIMRREIEGGKKD